MSQPFIGEIRMFAGNFAPQGWAFCNGQLMAISQNDALFALIGTTYGGNGQTTFALPNLQSRIPMHQGGSFIIGAASGEEQVALTTNTIPAHTHVPAAQTGNGGQNTPANGFWAASSLGQFSSAAPNGSMNAAALSFTGGNQAHNNIMPYLAVNFIISLFGIFPSRN